MVATSLLILVSCAVLVVVALCIKSRSTRVLDVLLVITALVAVGVQLCSEQSSTLKSRERFVAGSSKSRESFVLSSSALSSSTGAKATASAPVPPITTGTPMSAGVPMTAVIGNEAVLPAGVLEGLTLYASSLSQLSYGDKSGKTWRNIAPKALVLSTQCEADGSLRDSNFYFRTTPAFSRKDGFTLGTNRITGPLTHQLGLKGDQALTVFFVAQLTGDVPSKGNGSISLFKLFANTTGNNGVSLTLSNGVRVGDMIRADISLLLGNRPVMTSGGVGTLIDPRHKYLWMVVKN